MIGINVPIPVPMAYYSFGGWKASLFGDTHAHGTEGVHFFTRGKAITTLARPQPRRPRTRLPPKQVRGDTDMTNLDERTDNAVLPNGLNLDDARRAGGPSVRTRPHARLPLLVRPGGDHADDDRGVGGLLHLGRRRKPPAGLRLSAGLHQHRPPAPQGRRGHPGAGGQAVHDCSAARQRRPLRGGAADRGAHSRRPEQDLLHQRRRRRQRARGADGATAHRPLQGAHALPLLPRRHRHRDQHDR